MPRPRQAIELLHETLLGEAAASGTAAFLLSGDDLRYVAANDAACALLGYTRDELLALSVSDVVRADPERLRKDSGAVLDGATQHGTSHVRRKDGVELDVGFVSFRGAMGAVRQVVTVAWPLEPGGNGSNGQTSG